MTSEIDSSRLSYRDLGSEKLHANVIEDINSLFDLALQKELVPIIMIVGNLFIDIDIVHSLIIENRIEVWETELEQNFKNIKELIYRKKLETLEAYEKKSGLIGFDTDKNLNIYFDPEEQYIKLLCADPNKKADKSDPQTKDGHPYFLLRYNNNQILVKFLEEKVYS